MIQYASITSCFSASSCFSLRIILEHIGLFFPQCFQYCARSFRCFLAKCSLAFLFLSVNSSLKLVVMPVFPLMKVSLGYRLWHWVSWHSRPHQTVFSHSRFTVSLTGLFCFFQPNVGLRYANILLFKQLMQFFWIKAECLHFNHILIVWCKIHCGVAKRKRNYKNSVLIQILHTLGWVVFY